MRKYNNIDVSLPNGETMRLGTHMGKNGELSIKLRLPSDYWQLSTMFRAAEGTSYVNGKTVVTLDRR